MMMPLLERSGSGDEISFTSMFLKNRLSRFNYLKWLLGQRNLPQDNNDLISLLKRHGHGVHVLNNKK